MPIDLSGFTELQPVGLVLANQDPANLQFTNNPEPPPAPETLTWVGGGDNSVDDPGDWTPNAVPEAGDKLYMLDGTANIPGGNLAGVPLNVGYNAQGANPDTSVNPIINVTGGADVTIDVAAPYGDTTHATVNVSDSDTLAIGGGIVPWATGNPPGDNNLAINIANGATLTASGGLPYSQTTIAGDGDYDPTTAYFAEGSLQIQSDMIGTGTLNLGMLQADISGSVAAGVSVNLQVADTLTIDNPSTFLGTIIGPSPSASDQYNGGLPDEQINLQGLVADSYDISNDLLTLYKGGTVVDTVKFNQDANSLFVGQGASGVVVGMNEAMPAGVTALTQHIAISM